MVRGDDEYEFFNFNAEDYGKKFFDPIIDGEMDSIKQFVSDNRPPQPQKQDLPNYYYEWLTPSKLIQAAGEKTIYETVDWCEKIKKIDEAHYLRFYDVLRALIDEPDKIITRNLKNNNILKIISHSDRKEYKILCAELQIDSQNVLLLIQPLINQEQPKDEIVKYYTDFISQKTHLEPDDLAMISYRAYPWYTLADENLWLDIERDSQANLALSSEEENILYELTSENPSLPVFINGRAGSGKSTMLYYLFADLIYKKLTNDLNGDLIFITYNDRLLETAIEAVKNILNSHFAFSRTGYEKLNRSKLSHYFQTFHNFILNIFPDIAENFKPEKRITFHGFKSIWRRIYKRPQYLSPELSWFIIRAYIKGYKEVGYLEPEEYEELPRKEKAVPQQVFNDVYQHIWNFYKEYCEENELWDDQDLIRTALAKPADQLPEYIAIFCDEAQDFTRIELRFIMRLSMFSKYKLPPSIKSIPIVFAGDPMQTINPTGFRWETTGAIFHEEVIQELDPEGKLDVKLNFRELKYNYRSTPSITKFSNLILMWRCAMSKINLNPQIPWKTYSEGTKPYRLVIKDDIKDKLMEILKDKIVIVPVEEEQLIDFIKQDQLLKDIFTTADEDWPPKNVLTPLIAKGLEFDDVIIYKFGDRLKKLCKENQINPQLPELIKWTRENPLTFEIDYFFNQLYVSASRAKKNLFIVDSTEGSEILWRYTSLDKDFIIDLLPQDFEKSKWNDYITSSQVGEIQTLTLTPEEKRRNANELKERGIASREPSLLKRSAQYFEEIGYNSEAKECRAWASKFEGKYKESADLFKQIGKFEEAEDCLIAGEMWNELYRLYQEIKRTGPTVDTVEFIIAPEINSELFKKFTKFLTENILTDKSSFNSVKQKNNWKKAFERYISCVLSADKDFVDQETWTQCISVLKELNIYGRTASEALALAYFYTDDFENASEIWEKIGKTEEQNYYIAKSKTLKPPDNLQYLLKLEKYDEIIKSWENEGEPIDSKWADPVEKALIKEAKTNERARFYIKINRPEKLLNLFEEIIKSTSNPPDLFKTAEQILEDINLTKTTDVNKKMGQIEKVKLALQLITMLYNIDNYWDDKARIFAKTFRYLPYSDQSYENDKEISELFEKALKQLYQETLNKYLKLEEISAIYERTCSFKETLEFYYSYIERKAGITKGIEIHDMIKENAEKKVIDEMMKIQRILSQPDALFIAKRIIKVKLKQADYHKNKNEMDKYESLWNEAKDLAKLFQFTLEEIEEEPNYPQPFPITLEGFNPNLEPEIKTSSEFERSIIYSPFEVKINRKNRLILIIPPTYDAKKISVDENAFPFEYTYESYEIIINKPEPDVITLEFLSKITGTAQPEGKITIRF